MTTQSALKDLAKKIRLERKLNIAMRKILFDYSDELERSIREDGIIPSARALTGEETLTALINQYERTSKAFKKDFRSEVSKHQHLLLENKTIDDDIDENLQVFIGTAPIQRSGIIATTTQRETEQAVIRATRQLLESELELANADLARLTAENFRRNIPARSQLIATTETQNAAEGTKAIEAGTVQRSPEIPGVEVVIKVWDAILDGNERETHAEADGQEIPSTDAFRVGDSALLYPGDTTLGAEVKEIVNCRCSSTYVNIGPQ